ncbi:hypothetical protein [Stenotrophomonas sp. CFBP 13725]|uniref:hypothetical protein n=1 Tax=Stenotrophomonas sp. CFBP 13725 TaxID=2775297 RepID=UPI00178549BA|nr:hypothetical protein [Stenotrophomonas sp. CFBP 13725]MBD8635716.1 hypothetical protein [Stenotrophomonas sp. CFBP 13725]
MNNREVHYRYAIAALILAVCGAIGFGLVDDNRLVDRVSFALTINSLVLGVVAIIYSFIASHKQEQQLRKLIETNTKISLAATRITAISSEMGKHLREVPRRFDNVDKGLEELKNAALQTSSESEAINLVATAPANADPSASSGGGFTKYLTELTYAGIASVYMYFKAIESGKTIKKEETERDSIPEMHFQIGSLQAIEAGGYLKAKYSSSEITPVSMDDQAKSALVPFIERCKKIFPNDHAMIKMIHAIDELFP